MSYFFSKPANTDIRHLIKMVDTPNALDSEVLETTPLDPNLALATCVFLELF